MFLLDSEQSVRPADLPQQLQADMVRNARQSDRYYRLFTQMRVQGGADYVSYVRAIMRGESPERKSFGEYEFRLFDDLGEMHEAIRARDDEVGLSRLVAGYAWEWKSKHDRRAIDIEVDEQRLQWNQTQKDWITSPGAVDQVGSIHTVQGYDLNYVGVIIGPDLRFDPLSQQLWFDRSNYFDKKGMENNPRLGITYTDDDLRRFVANIYSVLLTRGALGTFVYVFDPDLRRYLRKFL